MGEPIGAMAPAYKDRTTGLVLVGILEILIGLFCLSGAALSSMALTLPSAAAAPQGVRQVVFGVAFYLIVAAFFVTIGMGTLLGRRWARALMLIASWGWLAMGVLALVAFLFMYPMMRGSMGKAFEQAAAQQSPGDSGAAGEASGAPNPVPDPELVGSIVLGCSLVFVGLFFVVLPALLVLFYRSPHVRATCEARDPRPRWTDRIPLPALSFVLLNAVGALCALGSVLAYGVVAVFGHVLTGTWAWLLSAVLTAALALAAWWAWRLEIRGWWLGVGVAAFGIASAIGTLLHPFDWNELYRDMGIDPSAGAPLDLDAWGRQFGWLTFLGMLPWFGFILWVRRYFARSGPTAQRI